jgi:hypothetical protein
MAGTGSSARKLTMDDIRAAAERLSNWGQWGADDEIGTLNYTRPEDIVAAARLVQKGKVEISGDGPVQSCPSDDAHRHGRLFRRA